MLENLRSRSDAAHEVSERRGHGVVTGDPALFEPVPQRRQPSGWDVVRNEACPGEQGAEDVRQRCEKGIGKDKADAVLGGHMVDVDAIPGIAQEKPVRKDDALGGACGTGGIVQRRERIRRYRQLEIRL